MKRGQGRLLRPLTLVAFGGNALLRREDLGHVAEQQRRAADAAERLAEVLERGHDLLLVHGNGPQVGHVLIQMEEASTKIPPGTLDVAVAQTEGSMGYLLELALRNRLAAAGSDHEVASVLTLVVVDRDDPGFERPAKPVGPFYSRYRAAALKRELGWRMAEDAGRGWRKVVASPRPLAVLGLSAVRALLGRGTVVIAGGGGGIPVIREAEDGRLVGVEAVIDKDRTASLMARELRADTFVNLTAVPQVARNFGKKNQTPIDRMTVLEARRLLERGQFPPGSMGPKVEAAIDYVQASGREAVVTDLEHLGAALAGEGGTRIVPGRSGGKGATTD